MVAATSVGLGNKDVISHEKKQNEYPITSFNV